MDKGTTQNKIRRIGENPTRLERGNKTDKHDPGNALLNETAAKVVHLSNHRLGILAFVSLSILYFFSIFQRVGTATIAPNLISDFKTDASILGLMSGMYFFSYAAAQIPVGIMLDRIGIRKTLTILGAVACIGDLIFSLSPSILVLALGRGLVGFGVGGFYVSSLKALAFHYNPKRYVTLTGILASIGNIGGIVASSPLVLLVLAIGWRDSFLLIFFFMLLFVGVAWLTMKEEEHKSIQKGRSVWGDLKTVFTNHELLKIAPTPLLVYGTYIAFYGLWVGPFLENVYGMSTATASLNFMFIGIGFIIAFPIAGLISDRMQRRKPMLLTGQVLNTIFWIAMALLGGLLIDYQIIGVFFYLGFGYGFVSIYMTLPVKLFPEEVSGSAIAGLNIFGFIGGGFFQYFMGFILDSTYGGTHAFPSYQLIFIMCAIVVLITFLFALFFKEPSSKEDKQPSSSHNV
jgi:predicted MFS family arabinose efflux permease